MKADEFRDLKQGSMTVNQYIWKFIRLSRYALKEVSTDKKKQDRFKKGLQHSLYIQPAPVIYPDFNTMMNKTLLLEEDCAPIEVERKRKFADRKPQGEFSYNNSFQASLKMSPFEALYGRKCRTPLLWSEVGERTLFGPALLKDTEEQVAKIRENLRAAQSRQKGYADNQRRDLTFEVGDYVYLKVSPIRGTRKFQIHGKLSPRYVGPYQILEKIVSVAYKIALPEEMSDVHNVFHVSQLKKCLRVPEEQVPLEVMDLQQDLQYEERPI
ncbi:uncharacterized protein LOC133925534 [Phragmites australis]|uniref:uncharacterized protein LOC133925534 n=1 Tax=Phragmites australis TaxID=29695 RepID=UPI002D784CF8|nr:uncharacterized protein LOC133925534 [Phragmites australis]